MKNFEELMRNITEGNFSLIPEGCFKELLKEFLEESLKELLKVSLNESFLESLEKIFEESQCESLEGPLKNIKTNI